MAQIEGVIAILLRCSSGHRFKTDFHTTDTDTFKQWVKEGHTATCSKCGISVIAGIDNATYFTDRGTFGMYFDQGEALAPFTVLISKNLHQRESPVERAGYTQTVNSRDILVWPDGFWCFREELLPGNVRGWGYRVIEAHTQKWTNWMKRNCRPL